MESILRSRALMISGRLLSKENIYMFVDEPSKGYASQFWNSFIEETVACFNFS